MRVCAVRVALTDATVLAMHGHLGALPHGCLARCADRFTLEQQALPDAVVRYNVEGAAAFGLVLPTVNAEAMQTFLDGFAETLAGDEYAAMVLDGARWHGAKALVVPPKVTLVPLPAYSPQLDQMKRVCLYLRERFLSLRVFGGYEAIVDACCVA